MIEWVKTEIFKAREREIREGYRPLPYPAMLVRRVARLGVV
jgi:hypothetical protein